MKSKWMRIPALCLALLLLGTAATVLPGAAELSVVFEENFDEYEGDVNASATKLATFFHVDANAIGDGYVRVEEDPSNGNLYLKNHVFTQVYSKTGIRDPYEFAMTVYEMQGGHQAGVFFRAPACECAYYEGDGGDPDNQISTGRSGIWVFVYRDRISVNIKAFDNSKPAKVANIYHAFPLPEGSDYGKGIELKGKTLGIVGFGHIGQTVAKLGAALGMKILVYSRTKRELPERYQWAELDALFKNADVVSLHCPLTDETRGLVNAERLNLMKPTAFLINTARGAVVDEAALAEALNSGRIAGAGLDVLVHEPPKKDDPLLTAKNCIVTPHIAWASRDARARLIKTVAENLKAFRNGTPQNVVS